MNRGLHIGKQQTEGADGSKHLRRAVASVVALAVAVAVFFLRREGVLQGIPALVLAVLLVLFLPWSTQLSRRILLGGAIFLGWVPLLWWLRLPVPQVDRVGILLALAIGALCGWVLWGPDVRTRARRLVPQVAMVDGMVLVAVALTLWMTWPLLFSSGGEHTLKVLLDAAWDHAAHASMSIQARTEGAIVPMLGLAPDGSEWVGAHYPQHFHGAATALTELTSGPAVGDLATEVLRYGRSFALMQVLTVGLLTAGVAQLSSLRQRSLVAWPVGAAVVAAFLFGPGAWTLTRGFSSFTLACATAGLAALLAVPMCRELTPLRVFALGGLVVATAHGWLLLAPLAVVGACVALVPPGRSRWPKSRVKLAMTIAAVAATLAASVAVVPLVLGSGGLGVLETVNEGVTHGPDAWSVLLLVAGLAMAMGLAAYARRLSRESALKGICLTAVPGTGLLVLGLAGAYQLITIGQLSYYFDKALWGVVLVSIVVLAGGTGLQLEASRPVLGGIRKYAAVAATALATLAALQLFGVTGSGWIWARETIDAPASAARRILDAVALAQTRPFESTSYLAVLPGDPHPVLASNWSRGLGLMWVYRANILESELAEVNELSINQAAEVAGKLLEENPQHAVIAAPEAVEEIRALLPAGFRHRVITWESP